jgi:small neutral amino acid transporter SnatA (MarC family)
MARRVMNRATRQRSRTRKRAAGAILVFLGILLWAGTFIFGMTSDELLMDQLLFLAISIGGAGVVGGIILISVTL